MCLETKAMLVALTVSAWKGEKSDQEAGEEVCQQKGAATDAARVVKRLMPKGLFAHVSSIERAVRDFHYRLTLPWLDGGIRLLPADLWQRYEEGMRELQRQHRDAVRELVVEYSRLLGDGAFSTGARSRMGDLYHDDEYPSPATLADRYGVTFTYVPFSTDFRTDSEKADNARLTAAAKADAERRVAEVVKNLAQRVASACGVFAARISPDKARFWDSALDEVRQLAETLDGLNVTGDEGIAGCAQAIRRLAQVSASDIRDDKNIRAKAIADADDVRRRASALAGVI